MNAMKRFEILLLSVFLVLLALIVGLRVKAVPAATEAVAAAATEEVEEPVKVVVANYATAIPQAEFEKAPEIEIEAAEIEEASEISVVYEMFFDEADVTALAQMVWGEARGCTLEDKRNCCITACNRADDWRFPDGVYECVTQPSQYLGYSKDNPIEAEFVELAERVLTDWSMKKQGVSVEWNDYNSFWGDGIRNHFYVY